MIKNLMQKKIDDINSFLSKGSRKHLLLAFLISAFFENIILINIGLNVKSVHILSLFLTPLLIFYKSKNKIHIKFLLLFVVLCVQTALSYFKFGYNQQVINMIFCTFVIILTFRFSDDFSMGDWMWIGKNASMVLFVTILINLSLQIEGIWEFLLHPSVYHPLYDSIFGGGCNLDASWLGVFAFISVGSSMWVPMLVFTVIFSALVNSRAGLLAALAFSTWVFVQWLRKKTNKKIYVLFWKDWNKRQKFLATFLTLSITVAFFILQCVAFYIQNKENISNIIENGVEQQETSKNDNEKLRGVIGNVVERSVNIGKEPGSVGRLRMWKWVLQESKGNYFGYGFGNGIEQIRKNDPQNVTSGNIHSIYLQVLLDQGWIGFLVFAIILLRFISAEIVTLAENPLAGFILCYLCLGLLQYRFVDVSIWYILGGYLSLKEYKRRNYDDKQ